MMALNIAETAKDLRGAADYLIAIDDVHPKRLAAIGFCMGGQLALRLKLMRSMAAGSTFGQMMQCMNFGMNKGRSGMGSGTGFGGMFADGAMEGPQQSLLGSETMLGHAEKESATASNGKAEGTPSPGADRADDSASGRHSGIVPASRPTGSISGDAALDDYNQLVDAYFRRLTTPQKKAP